MRINLIGYQFRNYDGYGRFAAYLAQALRRAGHGVKMVLAEQTQAAPWIQTDWGIDWGDFALSVLPPFYLQPLPPGATGRHWLYTMTEGSQLPAGWADIINGSGVERVLVPCAANAETFTAGGVLAPVHVLPGGTEPADFPLIPHSKIKAVTANPYTFLALGDRGARKGWCEAWAAFYRAFGPPEQTPDVKLLIKSRPDANELLQMIAAAEQVDPRIEIVMADLDMRDVYRRADCFVIPSRFEGWGMPHREAAMMGLPVITQRYSGMDDGRAHKWAIVISGGRLEPIPAACEEIAGQWMRADTEQLANAMIHCYRNPGEVAQRAAGAAAWLRANQTWDHTAAGMLEILGRA